MTRKFAAAAAIAFALTGASAMAQDNPAALVEDVRGDVQGAQIFDYVYPGDTLNVGDGTVVLSFFDSCAVQTINGGRAQIGVERADVSGGTVSTQTRPCKGANLEVASLGEAAASVKRLSPLSTLEWDESVTVSRQPIFKWAEERPARVELIYLDAPEPRVVWSGTSSDNVMELPAEARPLEVGKPYLIRAELPGGTVVEEVFSIDPNLPYPDVGANRLVALHGELEEPDADAS